MWIDSWKVYFILAFAGICAITASICIYKDIHTKERIPTFETQKGDKEFAPPLDIVHPSQTTRWITVTYKEPSDISGGLAYTRVYWCVGIDCTNWEPERSPDYPHNPVMHLSTDGRGGKVKKFSMEIPASPRDIIRVKVTAVDINNSETLGAISKSEQQD